MSESQDDDLEDDTPGVVGDIIYLSDEDLETIRNSQNTNTMSVIQSTEIVYLTDDFSEDDDPNKQVLGDSTGIRFLNEKVIT